MRLPVRELDAALPFYETVLGFRALSRSDTPHKSAMLALDSLATLAERRTALMPVVRRYLGSFERSPSKALQARAKQIRAGLRSRSNC
jgi:catechol 2,3-dioxygenase-like lactoylglutathione lyase family enzyme